MITYLLITLGYAAIFRIEDFICPLKYTNKLIDPSYAPKFLPCPFVQTERWFWCFVWEFCLSSFIEYRETVLEQQYRTEVHADPFVGVKIDLIDPLTYALPGPHVEVFFYLYLLAILRFSSIRQTQSFLNRIQWVH